MKPDPITAPTVTASAAMHAARLTPRQWDAIAAHLPLVGQPHRRAGSWRRCSAVDVVRFAAANRAFALGFSAPGAAAIVTTAVDRHLHGLATCGIELPPSILLGRLHGAVVTVARGEDGGFECRPAAQPGADDAAVVLNLGAIAADAIARLTEQNGACSAEPSPQPQPPAQPATESAPRSAARPYINEEAN